MINRNNPPNLFTRIIIIILGIIITIIILYNYFSIEPIGNISPSLIWLLLILVLLALSESFDNFSIGKLISLSRDVMKKDEDIQRLGKENYELRTQIVSVATLVNQQQSTANVNLLQVELAGEKESEERLLKEAQIEEAADEGIEEPKSTGMQDEKERFQDEEAKQIEHISILQRMQYNRELEKLALNKFIDLEGLNEYDVVRNTKLSSKFKDVDPVSDYSPIYDAYINKDDMELFIEIRKFDRFLGRSPESLYYMLTKVNNYRLSKNNNAKFILLLIDDPSREIPPDTLVRRFMENLKPAITSGILRVRRFSLNDSEVKALDEKYDFINIG